MATMTVQGGERKSSRKAARAPNHLATLPAPGDKFLGVDNGTNTSEEQCLLAFTEFIHLGKKEHGRSHYVSQMI